MLSNGWSEMWSLIRDVLDEVVEKFPELAPKLDKFLVSELDRKSRLYALSYRTLIHLAANDPERRSALIMQKIWTQFARLKARAESRYGGSGAATSRSYRADNLSVPARDGTGDAMQAALRDIQSQLVAMKKEMRSNGTMPPPMVSQASRKSGRQASFGFTSPTGDVEA